MARNGPLLTLETLARERPTVAIDGRAYGLRLVPDMTLAEVVLFNRWSERADALDVADPEATDEEIREAADEKEALVRRLVALVLPEAPVDQLTFAQCHVVIQAFMRATTETTAPPAPRRPTGATSSPASPRATAAA